MFANEPETDLIKRLYLRMSLDSISEIQNVRMKQNDYESFWKYEDARLDFLRQLEGKLSANYCEAVGGIAFMAASLGDANAVIKYGLQYEDIAIHINLTHTNNHALALGAISWAYWNLEDYEKAVEYGYKEVSVSSEVQTVSDSDLMRAYDDLRIKLFYLGRFAEAIELCNRQLLILKANSAGNTDLVFQIKSFMCEMYFNMNDYEYAKSIIEEYLDDNQDLTHQIYAYRSIGNYYYLICNIDKAINHYNHCMELAQQNDFELACAYEGLANCFYRKGDIAKYNYYTFLGNQIFNNILEPSNWDLLVSNKNLVTMYERAGDVQKAIEIMDNIYEMTKEGWLVGSLRHIEMGERFVKLLISGNDYERALIIIAQIKPFFENIYGNDSSHWVNLISNEAYCLHHLGKSMDAKKVLEELSINNCHIGNDALYNYLNTLSCVSVQIKDATTAKMAVEKMTNYVKAFNGIEKNLGLTYIGYIYYLLGEYKIAIDYYREAMADIRNNGIDYLMNYTPDNQSLQWAKYLHTLKREIPHVGNLICNEENFTDVIYNAVMYSKGLLNTTEHLWKRIILNSNNEYMIAKLYRYESLFEIKVKKDTGDVTDECTTEMMKLRFELCNYVKDKFPQYQNIFVSFSDIQKKLQDDDICIEFSLYQNEIGEWCFAALLLNNKIETPILVKLCKKSQLELVFKDSVYDPDEIWNLIWKPLEPYLSKTRRIYFSPDDILHSIAIEYLFDDNNQIMNERFEMYRVTSTSELLHKPNHDVHSIILMGGFDFDSDEKDASSLISQNDASLRIVLSKNNRFSQLPATKREVEEIASLFSKHGHNSVLVTGKNGTINSFNSISSSNYDILHVATHGFYTEINEVNYDENKLMLQSGLVFAGINSKIMKQLTTPLPIVTAFDISTLDLSNVKFVILSACQTGLGGIKEEGVFGLQKGFKQAGVKSLLISLWPVDDDATQILMTEFYKNYLRGLTKRESLLLAQKIVRETPGFEDPDYWAAFILLDALD